MKFITILSLKFTSPSLTLAISITLYDLRTKLDEERQQPRIIFGLMQNIIYKSWMFLMIDGREKWDSMIDNGIFFSLILVNQMNGVDIIVIMQGYYWSYLCLRTIIIPLSKTLVWCWNSIQHRSNLTCTNNNFLILHNLWTETKQ